MWGVIISIDLVSGDVIEVVFLLVKSFGYEVGVNYIDNKIYNLFVVLWCLEFDSELVYVGDVGFIEVSCFFERYGIEVSVYYWISYYLIIDIEVVWIKVWFSDSVEGEGCYIDGIVLGVVSVGLIYY